MVFMKKKTKEAIVDGTLVVSGLAHGLLAFGADVPMMIGNATSPIVTTVIYSVVGLVGISKLWMLATK